MDRHPVLEVLHARAAAGSRPGARDDRHRVALVVEGGGMRGIVSAAQCAALEAAGLVGALDLVVGASSGALNGAATIAGVAAASARNYADVFCDPRYLDPRRALRGRAVFDVAAALDLAAGELDAERHRRALESPIELHCVACDVATGEPVDLTGMRDEDELRAALLASSRLPLVGGSPTSVRGRELLDGGVAEPIPVPTALRLGATHVLVALTRRRGEPPEGAGSVGDRVIERWLRRRSEGLAAAYRARPARYTEEVRRTMAATEAPGKAPPWILGLQAPADAPRVARMERDPAVLRAAATRAQEVAAAVLAL